MIGIGSFFARWKNHEFNEISFHEAIACSIREAVKFELEHSSISYSNKIIYLNISPAVKSAVMIKKTEILQKIKEKTNRPILDIK